MTIPNFNSFMGDLRLKYSKGKKYYYIKIDLPFIKKDVYLGPGTLSEKELYENYKVKLLTETLYYFFKSEKENKHSKYVSDDAFITLELLRLSYHNLLKNYDKTDLQKYEENIYTNYVYGTTSIEGNTYTLRETDITLNDNLTVSGKSSREFYEIQNYSKLKEYLGNSTPKISIELIKTIHKIILSNIDDNAAGSFRKVDVGIRGTKFTPTPPPLIEQEMEDLIEWLRSNESTIYPVELVAIFHQKFEEIHPFIDGNGRVGRELVRILLKKYDFPSLFIGPSNRELYLSCLDKGNDDEGKSLTEFFISNLISSQNKLIKECKIEIEKSIEIIEFEDSKFEKEIVKFQKKLNKIKFKN